MSGHAPMVFAVRKWATSWVAVTVSRRANVTEVRARGGRFLTFEGWGPVVIRRAAGAGAGFRSLAALRKAYPLAVRRRLLDLR